MAVIKSGSSTSQMNVDSTSLAAQVEIVGPAGEKITNKKTYVASNSFTPSTTPQDLVTIFGSSTKIIRVQSMKIGTSNTAAGSQTFTLSKRSAVSTGGTEVITTGVPVDSGDAAATAVVKHLTTSANTPGTAVGVLVTKRVGSPAVVPGSFAGVREDTDSEMLPIVNGQVKPVTLRSATEGLAINFAGAALVSGQVHTFNIIWTEE
jgi:hypothetical protein